MLKRLMEATDAMPPETVVIGQGGRMLTLAGSAGQRRLAAGMLRRSCRCAGCTQARAAGTAVPPEGDIRITGAEAIGGYALNLAFSDGHDRGIFPFAYLAGLETELPQ